MRDPQYPDVAAAHPLDGKLEPETRAMGEDTAALYSIAISMKRIADALTGSAEGALSPYFFEQAAYQAGLAFERGRR